MSECFKVFSISGSCKRSYYFFFFFLPSHWFNRGNCFCQANGSFVNKNAGTETRYLLTYQKENVALWHLMLRSQTHLKLLEDGFTALM